jgi:molecular chaperone GrpE (heat shock protein)
MPDDLQGLDPTAEAERDVTAAEQEPDIGSLRRALNDLEAAKARLERDAARESDQLRSDLIAQLLPLLDNLDRTIRAAELNGEAPAVLEGVRLVRSQFATVLARYGLTRIDAKHQRFDPRVHDAISVVPVSHPSAHDVVVDQVEPGYRFGDRLVRPAKVVVGRAARRFH